MPFYKFLSSDQPFGLDAVQGASEQRTELYLPYCEGVVERAAQQRAKSFSGAAGCAGWQAGAAGRLA